MAKSKVDFAKAEVTEFVQKGIETIVPVMLERREDDVIKLKVDDIVGLLPEDMTVAQLKRAQEVTVDVSNILAGGLGKIGVDSKAQKLELAKVKLGHDTLSAAFAADYKYRNVATGEELTSHGRLTTSHVSLTGNRRRAGDFQQIAAAVSEAADSVFGK